MIQSTPNTPAFGFENLVCYWQMTRCEKYAFNALLEHIKPEVAIEIGTYKGGSLQIISKHAQKVYSIDISDEYKADLQDKFDNVDFSYGDSKELIPKTFKRIADSGKKVEFVLIDGDHTTEGVKSDIESVLQYRPESDMYIVFHDSFHPKSRKGIVKANWNVSKYVHYVEVDYIPGVFHHKRLDKAPPRSMFGGLCVALLKPEPRKGELVIHQSQKSLYNAMYRNSIHQFENKFTRKIGKKILSILGK